MKQSRKKHQRAIYIHIFPLLHNDPKKKMKREKIKKVTLFGIAF
jgi:hypothetical protein